MPVNCRPEWMVLSMLNFIFLFFWIFISVENNRFSGKDEKTLGFLWWFSFYEVFFFWLGQLLEYYLFFRPFCRVKYPRDNSSNIFIGVLIHKLSWDLDVGLQNLFDAEVREGSLFDFWICTWTEFKSAWARLDFILSLLNLS